MSTGLGLSGEGQDSGREGEHTVNNLLMPVSRMWKKLFFFDLLLVSSKVWLKIDVD